MLQDLPSFPGMGTEKYAKARSNRETPMLKKTIALAALAGAMTFGASALHADTFTIDLTHPIPTFKPMEGDATKPDLNQPWLDSKPTLCAVQNALGSR